MLQTELDAIKGDFDRKVSPAIRDALAAAMAALVASGQMERAAKAGHRAPPFALPDTAGTLRTSFRLRLRGPLVVVFYRGLWCPYCNADLAALESVAAQVRDLGASLVAISQQGASQGRAMRQRHRLSFPLLCDEDGAVADAFGVRWMLPPGIQAITRALVGKDLSEFQCGRGDSLPVPARFVIDRHGLIAYADMDPHYFRRPDPHELLPVLRALEKNRDRRPAGAS